MNNKINVNIITFKEKKIFLINFEQIEKIQWHYF